MKTVKIECDNCDEDLNDAGAMPSFRLRLTSESIPNSGGMVYSILTYPPIEHDLYFCGLGCLNHWMFEEHPQIHGKSK